MPEQINQNTVFSLKEVALSVQRTISNRYKQSFWVKAEINKLNYYPHSGHCYPDLLQKDKGKVVAQMRAMLWSTDFVRINRNFESVAHESLKDNISIMFLASIQFDPNYGLSLRIHDIDPSFSLGELEREKLANLATLKAEGIITRNKEIPMPLLPKRLAVISVVSSKGYADFMQLLEARMNGFVIEHVLFSSILQGEKAATQIRNRLSQIEMLASHFDLVAIIRGGGGEVGLAAFNDLELARKIATFPLPVFTGIGHATNQTVAEIVAHTNAITPSELAGILLEKFESFKESTEKASQAVGRVAGRLLNEYSSLHHFQKQFKATSERMIMLEWRRHDELMYRLNNTNLLAVSQKSETLKQHEQILNVLFKNALDKSEKKLTEQTWQLRTISKQYIGSTLNQLDVFERQKELLHPDNVLKRGFSISRIKGKSLKSANQIVEGDEIETELLNGFVVSKVISSLNK